MSLKVSLQNRKGKHTIIWFNLSRAFIKLNLKKKGDFSFTSPHFPSNQIKPKIKTWPPSNVTENPQNFMTGIVKK